MANKKISQLTVAAPLTGTEILPIVQGGVTVQTTAQDIADLAGGALPVETVYPTTDALEAGKKFLYLGDEWQYMTQAQIDSTGWTGLVSVGFPAPVSRVFNEFVLVPNGTTPINSNSQGIFFINDTVDFRGAGQPRRVLNITLLRNSVYVGAGAITTIRNAQLLTDLEDVGTQFAVYLHSTLGLTATVINSFFTQLPPTTKTATIDVRSNPGAATCDPTIATSKGYTVIT
jgi:hypothetical protein